MTLARQIRGRGRRSRGSAGRHGFCWTDSGDRLVALLRPRGESADGQPILVVDDDPGVRALLCTLLADAGYRVIEAADGQAALALLAQVPVAAVITDVQMPRMDGPTFVRRCRAQRAAVPPIVAISASLSGLLEAADAGVDATLAKPFDVEDLFHLIRGLVPPGISVPATVASQRPVTCDTEWPDGASLRAYTVALLTECRAHNQRATRIRAKSRSRLAALEVRRAARRESLALTLHRTRPSQ